MKDKSTIVLYSYFRSSCSYRVRIALNLKEIAYEYRAVHLLKDGGEQNKNDFLRINPKGEVPVLVHKNFVLSQSMAILLYLERMFPEKKIFPTDHEAYANCIKLCEVVNSGIQPLQGLRTTQQLESLLKVDKEGTRLWCNFWIEKGLEVLEELVVGPYALGENVTAADIFIIPQLYNAKRYNVDLNQFPKLVKLEEACLKLDYFARAHPDTCTDSPANS